MAEGNLDNSLSGTQFMGRLSACIIDIIASTCPGGQLMASATMKMGLMWKHRRGVRDTNRQILCCYIPFEI